MNTLNTSVLEFEKERKYLGSAGVYYKNLAFNRFQSRQRDESNEKFLMRLFKLGGCEPFNPLFRIAAVISRENFEAALRSSNLTLESIAVPHTSALPGLDLPNNIQLQCLFGRHRVYAAEHTRSFEQQRWGIDLYTDDLSDGLQKLLMRTGTNEKPPRQGEIFRNLLYDNITNRTDSHWRMRLQSSDQQKEVNVLLKRRSLRSILGELAEFPALFPDFRTGMIGRLLRLKQDNEIMCALKQILDFWTSALCGMDGSSQRLRFEDVKQIEMRCPSKCKADRDLLEPRFESGELFVSFSLSERGKIWQRLLQYQGLVPSFHSFFQNLKYMIAVSSCLKQLIETEVRQTVADAFEAAYVTRPSTSTHDIRTESEGSFRRAYQEVAIYAIQKLESLRPGSVLLDPSTKRASHRNAFALHEFAVFANNMGFNSQPIVKLVSECPERVIATQSLQDAQSDLGVIYDKAVLDSHVDQMASSLSNFRHQGDGTTKVKLPNTENIDVPLERRCGRPTMSAQLHISRFFSLPYVCRVTIDTFESISPTFISRDFFISFFGSFSGTPDDTANLSSALVPEECPKDTFQDQKDDLEVFATPWGHTETPDPGANGYKDLVSPSESMYTDNTPALSEDFGEGDDRQYSLPQIHFVRARSCGLECADPVHIRTEPVLDDNATNVRAAAEEFNGSGCFVLDPNDSRILHPSQCLRAGLQDREHRLIVVSGKDMESGGGTKLDRSKAGVKRRGDVLHSDRPTKFLATD